MTKYSELTLAGIVAARAASEPDTAVPAIVGGGATAGAVRTYRHVWEKGQRLAAGLAALGVAAGDRIALLLAPSAESVDTYVAASLLGATVVALDPHIHADALAHALEATACKGAIAGDHALAGIADVRERVATLRWVLGVATDGRRSTPAQLQAFGVRPYAAVAAADPGQCRFAGSQPDDAMQIVLTANPSGGTERTVVTHRRYCETTLRVVPAFD